MQHRTIIEPFRIKSVEPIRLGTAEERAEQLRLAIPHVTVPANH